MKMNALLYHEPATIVKVSSSDSSNEYPAADYESGSCLDDDDFWFWLDSLTVARNKGPSASPSHSFLGEEELLRLCLVFKRRTTLELSRTKSSSVQLYSVLQPCTEIEFVCLLYAVTQRRLLQLAGHLVTYSIELAVLRHAGFLNRSKSAVSVHLSDRGARHSVAPEKKERYKLLAGHG